MVSMARSSRMLRRVVCVQRKKQTLRKRPLALLTNPPKAVGMLYQAVQSATDSHFNIPDPFAPPRPVSVSRAVATAPVGPPLRIRAPPSAAKPSSPASSLSSVWPPSPHPPAHASSSPCPRPLSCSSRSASPAGPSRRA